MKTLAWIFALGAIGSFLYAMYVMFRKKETDASLDSTLRRIGTGGTPRVKESSRILEPQPDMTRPTDAEESPIAVEDEVADEVAEAEEDAEYQPPAYEGVGTPEPAPPRDETPVAPAEVLPAPPRDETPVAPPEMLPPQPPAPEEAEEGSDSGFLSGLDEDVKSDYRERQPLESEAEAPEQPPIQDSSEDEVFNVMSDQLETPAFGGDYYSEQAGSDEAVIESDDVLAEEDAGGFEEVADTDGEPERAASDYSDEEKAQLADQVANVFDSFEEAPPKPTPRDISVAFHNLEEKAKTERQEAGEGDDEGTDAEDAEEQGEDEEGDDRSDSEGDGSLFT